MSGVFYKAQHNILFLSIEESMLVCLLPLAFNRIYFKQPLFLSCFLCFNLVTFKVPFFLFVQASLPPPLSGNTLHRTLIYKTDAN